MVAKENVVDALGVGLHVAREAAEELKHVVARLLVCVLKEDVIAVCDLHEVVTLLARLPHLLVRSNGLHQDAGCIGRDAHRGAHRFVAHRGDDRGSKDAPEFS